MLKKSHETVTARGARMNRIKTICDRLLFLFFLSEKGINDRR